MGPESSFPTFVVLRFRGSGLMAERGWRMREEGRRTAEGGRGDGAADPFSQSQEGLRVPPRPFLPGSPPQNGGGRTPPAPCRSGQGGRGRPRVPSRSPSRSRGPARRQSGALNCGGGGGRAQRAAPGGESGTGTGGQRGRGGTAGSGPLRGSRTPLRGPHPPGPRLPALATVSRRRSPALSDGR